MKKILVVSNCGKRRGTIGLIGSLLMSLKNLDKSKYDISLLDTNFFEQNHNPKDYEVDHYFRITPHCYDKLIRLIPLFRTKFAYCSAVSTFSQLLNNNHYDVVLVYQVPEYVDKLVKLAHINNIKVLLFPFGSDILRVNETIKKKLMKAFSDVDGVCCYDMSGTMNAARDIYNVPICKLKIMHVYSAGVKRLLDLRGKKTRREMMELLNIPFSNYNIVCGYSGRKSHRHQKIINALIEVRDALPENYQIIFPMTYGAGMHHEMIIKYAAQLKKICDTEHLNTIFLLDFMSEEQIAYLHLITDLFIEIQPTDNGNGFMIESLCAENQIITGRWLRYKNFERFGTPYHLIDTPDDLPNMLRGIFLHQVKAAIVPNELIDYYSPTESKKPEVYWRRLFDEI